MTANSGIIFPELSYQLMGIFFEVHGRMGNSYQEKYYQRAVELEFKNRNIRYVREKEIKLQYKDNPIGKYFLDFVVEDRTSRLTYCRLVSPYVHFL